MVYGYDDAGYYFSGPRYDSGMGPKPWQELGDTEIGVLEMYRVRPRRAADDARTVREAIEFALEHARSPAKWIYPRYRAGLAGFESWMQALHAGKADGFGVAYNAAVWAECRGHAVRFLAEAKDRIDGNLGPLFDEAAGHYETVAQRLQKVSEAFPFPPAGDEVEDRDRCKTAVGDLVAARGAEESGLATLERILAEL